MDRKTKIELAVLAGLLGILGLAWYFRNQLGVIVSDQAEKYWPLPAAGEPYRSIIQSASVASGMPFDLLSRQLMEESGFNPNAMNPSGAEGIAQLIPKYYPGVDPLDPAQAIPAQASSLASYYNRFDTYAQALAAYNWGPGNVDKAINSYGDQWLVNAPTETQRYVGQILSDVPLEPLPAGALT